MSDDTSRRGTWVIVRCFGGKARRVRVWEENAQVVWAASDEAYRRRIEELDTYEPIGFRRSAVFEDNPDFFEEFGGDVPIAKFWEKLTPYTPPSSDTVAERAQRFNRLLGPGPGREDTA